MSDKEDIEDEDEDEEDEEGEFAHEILGVSAPTIDLGQVGVSRELAIVLGPDGTKELIEGGLFRGISRTLHPDVSSIEGAAEAYAQISSVVTAIGRLDDEEWRETFRRFISRRDDLLSRLQLSEQRLAIERQRYGEASSRLAELQLLVDRHTKSPAAAVDLVRSLLLSGISRPSNPLSPAGGNTLDVAGLLNCVVTTDADIHYVARPGRVNSQRLDMAPTHEKSVKDEARKYQGNENRGIFYFDPSSAAPPRVIAGDYKGKKVRKNRPNDEVAIPIEQLPDILADTIPEISPASNLLVVSPAFSGPGKPVGIRLELFGGIANIFGPYNVAKTKVTGPHI